eukprot:1146483-Pelagomonas_calceolata.AAC.5
MTDAILSFEYEWATEHCMARAREYLIQMVVPPVLSKTAPFVIFKESFHPCPGMEPPHRSDQDIWILHDSRRDACSNCYAGCTQQCMQQCAQQCTQRCMQQLLCRMHTATHAAMHAEMHAEMHAATHAVTHTAMHATMQH